MSGKPSNNSNESKKEVKTLLLVGNSPNLVDEYNSKAEWSRMLINLQGGLEDYLEGIQESSSFLQIMQAIGNLYRMHARIDDRDNTRKKIEEKLIKWFHDVSKMAPTAVHRMLVDLKFDCYLTTNYDYALDKVLTKDHVKKIKHYQKKDYASVVKAFFEEGKASPKSANTDVYHIHGEISDPTSIIMSPRSYQIAVEELDKYWKEKNKSKEENSTYVWMSEFCSAEVHICGFNLRPEESIFWYALEQRFLTILEKKIPDTYLRTFVYLFYKEGDENDMKEKKALETLLKTYAVTTVYIPVRGNDYVSAWKLLIGEMLLRKNKWHIYHRCHENEDAGEDEELSDEMVECLQKTEQGGGRLASKGTNMSTAFTVHYQFPNHCLFTLSSAKLANIISLGRWLCYCKIKGHPYMYEFSDLSPFIHPCSEAGSKNDVQVLVNYKTGELFCLNDKKDKISSIGSGCRITNIESFVKRIKVPK